MVVFAGILIAQQAIASPVYEVAVAGPNVTDPCVKYTTEQQCQDLSLVSERCRWDIPQDSPTSLHPSCWHVTCSEYYAEVDCIKEAGCTWHNEITYCQPPGVKIPCNKYSSVPTLCIGQCEMMQSIGLCIDKSQPPPCNYFSQSDCPANVGCVFNTAVQRCIVKGTVPACNDYFTQSSCPAANCTWASSLYMCLPSNTPIPCNLYFQGNDCPTSTCQWTGNYCLNQGETPACSLGSSAETCDATRCVWHPAPMYVCWAKDKPIPCQRYFDIDLCSHSGYCAWEAVDYMCVDCPDNTNCTAATAPPAPTDSGLACSTYLSNTACPFSRCFYEESDDHPGGICRNKYCQDLYPQSNCIKNASCHWDMNMYICYSGSTVPCNVYYSSSLCPSTRCAWDNNANECHDIGVDVKCSDYFAKSVCPSPRCTWHTDVNRCYNPGVPVPCDYYLLSDQCPKGTCQWVQNAGCWPAGERVPCQFFSNVGDCDAHNYCRFDQQISHVCMDCLNGNCPNVPTGVPTTPHDYGLPCETYTAQSSCLVVPRCKWFLDVNSGTYSCVNKTCTDRFTELDCENAACSWAASFGLCYPTGGHIPCNFYYDQALCTANSCNWDDNVRWCDEQGQPTPCSVYSQTQCPSPRCVFETAAEVCRGANEKIPCSQYYQEMACPLDRCNWDGSAFVCFQKGQTVPCLDYFDAARCPRDHCVWNSIQSLCVDMP